MKSDQRNPSFEDIRAQLSELEPTQTAQERVVRFLDASHALGSSRDDRGRLEIMLVGPELIAHSPSIRARMLFDKWLTVDESSLHANRLVLEPGDQFDAAGALICAELIKLGFAADPAEAFARAEPVIEMVLSHAEGEEALITGLAGELLALDWLTGACLGGSADAIAGMWHGWKPSSRDLQLGPIGLEVKTTTSSASLHHVQGWYQVEPGIAVDGSPETALYLLSIGITWLNGSDQEGQSIRQLTASIASRLTEPTRARFLRNVRSYGGGLAEIDESGLAIERSFRRPFMNVFERLYDLSDSRVKIPSAADLAIFEHVQLNSVSFMIQLPEQVRGDLNPVVGSRAIVSRLLAP